MEEMSGSLYFLDGRSKFDVRFTEPFPSHLYLNVTQEPLAWALLGDASCGRLRAKHPSPLLMDPATPETPSSTLNQRETS